MKKGHGIGSYCGWNFLQRLIQLCQYQAVEILYPPYVTHCSQYRLNFLISLLVIALSYLEGSSSARPRSQPRCNVQQTSPLSIESHFRIAFPDLLYSLTRDLHIQSDLFCGHPFLFLPDNPMNLALVQLHNPCYELIPKARAKYF